MRRRIFTCRAIALYSTGFLFSLSVGFSLMGLATILAERSKNLDSVRLAVGIFVVCAAIAQLILGKFVGSVIDQSEQQSPKMRALVIANLLCFSLSLFAASTAPSAWFLIIIALVEAISLGCVYYPIGRSWLTEITVDEKLYSTVFSVYESFSLATPLFTSWLLHHLLRTFLRHLHGAMSLRLAILMFCGNIVFLGVCASELTTTRITTAGDHHNRLSDMMGSAEFSGDDDKKCTSRAHGGDGCDSDSGGDSDRRGEFNAGYCIDSDNCDSSSDDATEEETKTAFSPATTATIIARKIAAGRGRRGKGKLGESEKQNTRASSEPAASSLAKEKKKRKLSDTTAAPATSLKHYRSCSASLVKFTCRVNACSHTNNHSADALVAEGSVEPSSGDCDNNSTRLQEEYEGGNPILRHVPASPRSTPALLLASTATAASGDAGHESRVGTPTGTEKQRQERYNYDAFAKDFEIADSSSSPSAAAAVAEEGGGGRGGLLQSPIDLDAETPPTVADWCLALSNLHHKRQNASTGSGNGDGVGSGVITLIKSNNDPATTSSSYAFHGTTLPADEREEEEEEEEEEEAKGGEGGSGGAGCEQHSTSLAAPDAGTAADAVHTATAACSYKLRLSPHTHDVEGLALRAAPNLPVDVELVMSPTDDCQHNQPCIKKTLSAYDWSVMAGRDAAAVEEEEEAEKKKTKDKEKEKEEKVCVRTTTQGAAIARNKAPGVIRSAASTAVSTSATTASSPPTLASKDAYTRSSSSSSQPSGTGTGTSTATKSRDTDRDRDSRDNRDRDRGRERESRDRDNRDRDRGRESESRDSDNRDRDRGRERESRDRDNRDKDRGRDREGRDSDKDRGRDRDRDRDRDTDRDIGFIRQQLSFTKPVIVPSATTINPPTPSRAHIVTDTQGTPGMAPSIITTHSAYSSPPYVSEGSAPGSSRRTTIQPNNQQEPPVAMSTAKSTSSTGGARNISPEQTKSGAPPTSRPPPAPYPPTLTRGSLLSRSQSSSSSTTASKRSFKSSSTRSSDKREGGRPPPSTNNPSPPVTRRPSFLTRARGRGRGSGQHRRGQSYGSLDSVEGSFSDEELYGHLSPPSPTATGDGPEAGATGGGGGRGSNTGTMDMDGSIFTGAMMMIRNEIRAVQECWVTICVVCRQAVETLKSSRWDRCYLPPFSSTRAAAANHNNTSSAAGSRRHPTYGPMDSMTLMRNCSHPGTWQAMLLATAGQRMLQGSLIPLFIVAIDILSIRKNTTTNTAAGTSTSTGSSEVGAWSHDGDAGRIYGQYWPPLPTVGGTEEPIIKRDLFATYVASAALLVAATGGSSMIIQQLLLRVCSEEAVVCALALFAYIVATVLLSIAANLPGAFVAAGMPVPEEGANAFGDSASRGHTPAIEGTEIAFVALIGIGTLLALCVGSSWSTSMSAMIAKMYPKDIQTEVQGVIQQLGALACFPAAALTAIASMMNAFPDTSTSGSDNGGGLPRVPTLGLLFVKEWPAAPFVVALIFYLSAFLSIIFAYEPDTLWSSLCEGCCQCSRQILSAIGRMSRCPRRSPPYQRVDDDDEGDCGSGDEAAARGGGGGGSLDIEMGNMARPERVQTITFQPEWMYYRRPEALRAHKRRPTMQMVKVPFQPCKTLDLIEERELAAIRAERLKRRRDQRRRTATSTNSSHYSSYIGGRGSSSGSSGSNGSSFVQPLERVEEDEEGEEVAREADVI